MTRSRWIEWAAAAVGVGISEPQQGEEEDFPHTGVCFLIEKHDAVVVSVTSHGRRCPVLSASDEG